MKQKFALTSILVVVFLLFGCVAGEGQSIPLDATATPRAVFSITPLSDVQVLSKSNRPNILVIMTDDLDLEMGTIEYMPNLQKLLVAQGLTVEEFFVSLPFCCPSRSTFLRGQFAHNHKVYRNDQPNGGFEEFYSRQHETSTLATWLQAAGYRTVLLGKYLNGYPSKDNLTYIPVGWNEWYSSVKGSPFAGYQYTINENGKLVRYKETGEGESQYMTDVLARKTVDFIQRAGAEEVPFFVYLSTYAPHAPVQPAPRHLALLSDLKVPRVPSFNEADVSDKPAGIRSDPLLTEDEIRKNDRRYRDRVLTMLAVDEMIGQLVETLTATGQLDNTYIIFTSDNGYHFGQHRRREGKGSFYEEDIHVPLIIRGPGVKAGASLEGYVVGNVDLAPTIAELAGVTPPDYVDGSSMVRLFDGVLSPASEWRSAYLLEFYGFNEKDGDPNAPAPLPEFLGLRTQHYLYVEYKDGFIELYDLQNDPYELENIASQADQSLLTNLSGLLHALETCSGKQCSTFDDGLIE
jgi:N-acetylglucosamine-6-sulfatase